MPFPVPKLAPPTHPLERLPEEWSARLVEWGEPRYRGLQVFRWIHQRGVVDPAQMTDLPKSLRARLAEEGLALPIVLEGDRPSADGTLKLLGKLADGARIETVLLPQLSADDPDVDDDAEPAAEAAQPVTQCISTQVGCAMGCVFCASGVAGLTRHLTAAEIVAQLHAGRARLTEGQRLRNVVLMGMGEPLHNYDAVARALVLMGHEEGLNLSTRRVTLSTSGVVPQIDRLAADFDGKVQLAISLHAVDDDRRSAIMPINRKYPLDELVRCLRRYPLPKRRRITIEYTLIAGVNDEVRDADRMAKLLRDLPVKVNLIPMNPVASSKLHAPEWESVERFQQRLFGHGIATFVRRRRGDDIDAACGQLAFRGEPRGRGRRMPVVS